jgi:hypothetical protein
MQLNAPLPQYSGMTIAETNIDPEQVSSRTATMVGNGSYMALSAQKALMAQRNSDKSVRVYMVLTVTDIWAEESDLDWKNTVVAKETILSRYFEDWADGVKDLVRESGGNALRVWPLYGTPKPCEGGGWKTDLPVTLIGDAAHVMPPWTGRGVNMALLDSVELGRKMTNAFSLGASRVETIQAICKAFRAYEVEMCSRMDREKAQNLQSQELLFAEDSPQTLQRAMNEHVPGKI